MPVNLNFPENLLSVDGLSLSAVEAGIRYTGRSDLVLMSFAEGTKVSAVFTKNKCCAAPVAIAKEHLAKSSHDDGDGVRALLINSGNANAVTGELGLANAKRSCEVVAQALLIDAEQVLPFSTGVIGEQLNMTALESAIPSAVNSLSDKNWLDAAKGIMTTDTIPKGASRTIEINGESVTITGISKGSGMICPNMATMLAYVVTDADIDQPQLDELLKRGVDESFNRITVDSDTSTNDALVLAATGKSKAGKLLTDTEISAFYDCLRSVLVEIATAIIRDGEGATKFVKIEVSSGQNIECCKTIAYDIAHSPLVKTALFASDPNWGRILMALGKSAVESLDMDRVNIAINDLALISAGQPAPSYTEEAGQQVFNEAEINISVELNTGTEAWHVWTSDLSHEYVSINADYRS